MNEPGLEEICQLDEKQYVFEYFAGNPFSKMESRKSIDTMLNVSQVFVYCILDIDSMAVYFGETFLMGVVNE